MKLVFTPEAERQASEMDDGGESIAPTPATSSRVSLPRPAT